MAKATGEQSISSYVVAFLSVEGSVGRAASMPSIVQKFSGVFTPKQIWTATIRMEDAGLIHRFLIDGQPYFTTTSCAGKVFVPLPFKLSPGIAELYAAIGIRPPPLILRQERARRLLDEDDQFGSIEDEDSEEWRVT